MKGDFYYLERFKSHNYIKSVFFNTLKILFVSQAEIPFFCQPFFFLSRAHDGL